MGSLLRRRRGGGGQSLVDYGINVSWGIINTSYIHNRLKILFVDPRWFDPMAFYPIVGENMLGGRALQLVVQLNIKHNIKICIISGLCLVRLRQFLGRALRLGQAKRVECCRARSNEQKKSSN